MTANRLPAAFLAEMKRLLQDEFAAFAHSLQADRSAGLRVNTLKVSVERFLKLSPHALRPVPWSEAGFYYDEADRPGRHPYHDAGLYYMQEPSAMAVGELTDPQPGENVLDLCAAPGGKTTHLAGKMNGVGLLLANEIHPARARILSQNVERMGVRNAIVVNETPNRLAERFPGSLDRVLVDAPCSGEGMFRKDPETRAEWSPDQVRACAVRQRDIMRHAAAMVRPGGRLVYSTCTFNPDENERVIAAFLRENPQYVVENVRAYGGFGRGRPEWAGGEAVRAADVGATIRIWPHQVRGEGHFIAVLRRTEGKDASAPRHKAMETADRYMLKPFLQFAADSLRSTPEGKFVLFGSQVYIVPRDMPPLHGLKVLRPGWHLGEIRKGRFEPSHALAMSLDGSQVNERYSLPADSPELAAYLRGEPLPSTGPKGWTLVEADGFAVGWGKRADHTLKNHYPKGLRRAFSS